VPHKVKRFALVGAKTDVSGVVDDGTEPNLGLSQPASRVALSIVMDTLVPSALASGVEIAVALIALQVLLLAFAYTQRRRRLKAEKLSDEAQDDAKGDRSAAELRNMQHKLTHLTRVAMLGELSGALAHELQQPLTAILCNAHAAQLLTHKEPLNVEELQEILGEIISDDKNAGQIIQRLRALLMRGETQFQQLEIADVLDDVLALARGTLRERNVQVHARVEAGIPEVHGDRVELQQVLLNLVLNASESMSLNPTRDRRVEIVVENAEKADGGVRVSVLDCGKGIDVAQLERVFEPFFSTKEGGLGLGLAISHSIVAAHGGRLWATNRTDRGAAFHFTLPVTIGKRRHEWHNEYSVHSG
jgi:C4-dicarboxylate-specific signal transduction histidine kinase